MSVAAHTTGFAQIKKIKSQGRFKDFHAREKI